jgi:glucose/arabinose dehydrogenase
MVATHWTRRLGPALATTLALVVLSVAPAAANIPTVVAPGFQDVALTNDIPSPTAVRFAPAMDGRMFVALKRGEVLAYDRPQDPTPTTVIDLHTDVDDYWDRGLLGMALDPSFNTNGGWMYLLYARDALPHGSSPQWNDQCGDPHDPTLDGCVVTGKLVRVMVNALGVATGQPQTLIQDEWCQQFPSHSVGALAFGPDGMLYASAGEGANFNGEDYGQWESTEPGSTPRNPCGDPFVAGDPGHSEGGALRAQDVRTDGDPAGLSGAVIRVDPTTGAAAPGNPFSASADPNKRRVIAYGLRNPFRFTFRPGTSDIWIGDVGWTKWEEIDKLDADDGVAENFGWPCVEGPDRVPDYTDVGLCQSLPNSAVKAPAFSYFHDGVLDGCTGQTGAGSSISGLAFYGDGSYPDSYNGGLFFTDFARSCIWFMPKGANGDPNAAGRQIVARGTPGDGPVDLQTAPNGDLVYVYHHADFGAVHEVRPANALSASLTATKHANDNFTLDASGSHGEDLTYEWDFDGDDTWVAGPATVDHEYTGRRAVDVSVRVTDRFNETTIATTRISVGNTPPAPRIAITSAPADGWSVGDALRFDGTAADPDPQETNGSDFLWTLTILHCVPGAGCHRHTVETRTGPDATFTAPDHDYPSKLEVSLKATDDLGFSGVVPVVLEPRTAQLMVRATPAPVVVRLNGRPGNSVSKTFIRGSTTTASTATPQHANDQDYRFIGWSDGSTALTRTFKLLSNTTLTARFLSRPGAKAPPGIRGTSRTRHTLRARTGDWLGNELTYGYQWLRCAPGCAPIGGATATTYRVRDADLGKRLAVRVIARNDLGSATQRSAETAKILEGVPPKIRLTGAKRVRLGDGRLKLKVGCPSERCRLSVRGVLLVNGHKAGVTRAVRKTLGRGKKATLTIRLGAKLRRQALKALKARKKVTVRFDVIARDALSNRATSHRTVRLRP